MEHFLEKISSYNLFNYLLPGVLFVIFSNTFTTYSFIQDDIILALFSYYFVGLVISRLGSLILEPVLKKVKLLKFGEYKKFLEACKTDSKIELLSEANNMYRTLCAMFIALLILKIYEILEFKIPLPAGMRIWTLVITLLVIFLFSYVKQSGYITKRVGNQII